MIEPLFTVLTYFLTPKMCLFNKQVVHRLELKLSDWVRGGRFFFFFLWRLVLIKAWGLWHTGSQSFKAITLPIWPCRRPFLCLLSCLLNTCKKYYRARLPEHGTWPFQVSEPTSNKPTKTIQQGPLPGQLRSSRWLTDNCSSSRWRAAEGGGSV